MQPVASVDQTLPAWSTICPLPARTTVPEGDSAFVTVTWAAITAEADLPGAGAAIDACAAANVAKLPTPLTL
ncbi:MAG TPA: hypothetical protein VGF89_00875 [Steroidobacteraceae bacterium]